MQKTKLNRNIVPTHLAVQAMRDNGYKNAAYAIAELMDNAIQAGASNIELLCAEERTERSQRITSRVKQIAVLDDGSGMDEETLIKALQFGNGNYLESSKHTGIGRYGMGLPCSSISQCRRVDVWTWQDGVQNAIHSYLDLDEIKRGDVDSSEVPMPKKNKIPKIWQQVGKSFGEKGTLVLWSNIDLCMWRTASAIIRHSEYIIGRMYRKFLNTKKVKIRMVSFDAAQPSNNEEKFALPNDPIYLMEKTSCPAPFDKEPMFKPDGDNYTFLHQVEYGGKKYPVRLTFTYAKEEARQGHNPGSKPHGKHAARNVGVSVVRADRELELDQSWVNTHDPRERWWGVEIDFPPALDEIFGVTNNKQSARHFNDIAKLDFQDMCDREGLSPTEMTKLLKDDEDPIVCLIEIANLIKTRLGPLRTLIQTQTKSTDREIRKLGAEAEMKATEATKKRQEEGHTGESDKSESDPDEKRKKEVQDLLVQLGETNSAAKFAVETAFNAGLKYIFTQSDMESPAFFTVKPKGGEVIISLNMNHPAYHKLFEVLDDDVKSESIEELKQRLTTARDALKLLLMAWARYEDEQPDGSSRTRAQQMRFDWGVVASEFLQGE